MSAFLSLVGYTTVARQSKHITLLYGPRAYIRGLHSSKLVRNGSTSCGPLSTFVSRECTTVEAQKCIQSGLGEQSTQRCSSYHTHRILTQTSPWVAQPRICAQGVHFVQARSMAKTTIRSIHSRSRAGMIQSDASSASYHPVRDGRLTSMQGHKKPLTKLQSKTTLRSSFGNEVLYRGTDEYLSAQQSISKRMSALLNTKGRNISEIEGSSGLTTLIQTQRASVGGALRSGEEVPRESRKNLAKSTKIEPDGMQENHRNRPVEVDGQKSSSQRLDGTTDGQSDTRILEITRDLSNVVSSGSGIVNSRTLSRKSQTKRKKSKENHAVSKHNLRDEIGHTGPRPQIIEQSDQYRNIVKNEERLVPTREDRQVDRNAVIRKSPRRTPPDSGRAMHEAQLTQVQRERPQSAKRARKVKGKTKAHLTKGRGTLKYAPGDDLLDTFTSILYEAQSLERKQIRRNAEEKEFLSQQDKSTATGSTRGQNTGQQSSGYDSEINRDVVAKPARDPARSAQREQRLETSHSGRTPQRSTVLIEENVGPNTKHKEVDRKSLTTSTPKKAQADSGRTINEEHLSKPSRDKPQSAKRAKKKRRQSEAHQSAEYTDPPRDGIGDSILHTHASVLHEAQSLERTQIQRYAEEKELHSQRDKATAKDSIRVKGIRPKANWYDNVNARDVVANEAREHSRSAQTIKQSETSHSGRLQNNILEAIAKGESANAQGSVRKKQTTAQRKAQRARERKQVAAEQARAQEMAVIREAAAREAEAKQAMADAEVYRQTQRKVIAQQHQKRVEYVGQIKKVQATEGDKAKVIPTKPFVISPKPAKPKPVPPPPTLPVSSLVRDWVVPEYLSERSRVLRKKAGRSQRGTKSKIVPLSTQEISEAIARVKLRENETTGVSVLALTRWASEVQKMNRTNDKKEFLKSTIMPYVPLLHMIYSPHVSFGITSKSVEQAVKATSTEELTVTSESFDKIPMWATVPLTPDGSVPLDHVISVLRLCEQRALTGKNAINALAAIVLRLQVQQRWGNEVKAEGTDEDMAIDKVMEYDHETQSYVDANVVAVDTPDAIECAARDAITDKIRQRGQMKSGETPMDDATGGVPGRETTSIDSGDGSGCSTSVSEAHARQVGVVYDVINRSLRVGFATKTINSVLQHIQSDLDNNELRSEEWFSDVEESPHASHSRQGGTASRSHKVGISDAKKGNGIRNESIQLIPSFPVALAEVGDLEHLEREMGKAHNGLKTSAKEHRKSKRKGGPCVEGNGDRDSGVATVGVDPPVEKGGVWYASRKYDGVRCLCVCIPQALAHTVPQFMRVEGNDTQVLKAETVDEELKQLSGNPDADRLHGTQDVEMNGTGSAVASASGKVVEDVEVRFYTRMGHRIHTLEHLEHRMQELYTLITKHTTHSGVVVFDGELTCASSASADQSESERTSESTGTTVIDMQSFQASAGNTLTVDEREHTEQMDEVVDIASADHPHANHRDAFSTVMQQLRRKDESMPQPVFWVLDILHAHEFFAGAGKRPFSERVQVMRCTARKLKNVSRNDTLARTADGTASQDVITPTRAQVHIIDQMEVQDIAQVKRLVKHANTSGWEGIMLRKGGSVYSGTRTTDLVKLKPWLDGEYTVTGVETGKMRQSVARQRKLEKEQAAAESLTVESGTTESTERPKTGEVDDKGNYIVDDNQDEKVVTRLNIDHNGCKVGVGSGLSMAQRRAWAKDPSLITGSVVTVKYREELVNRKTRRHSLRHPTLVHVHTAEGRIT